MMYYYDVLLWCILYLYYLFLNFFFSLFYFPPSFSLNNQPSKKQPASSFFPEKLEIYHFHSSFFYSFFYLFSILSSLRSFNSFYFYFIPFFLPSCCSYNHSFCSNYRLSLNMANSIPTEFSFPLRHDNQSSPINSSYSPKKSHSRTYTGIEIPLSLQHSQQSPSFPSMPLTPPDVLSPPKSPHKKHAHRRSAAISHDFRTSPSFNDFTAAMNNQDQQTDMTHSPYSLQSPALTFTSNSSSSSSLPMQSSESLNSIDFTHRITSWNTNILSRKNKPSSPHFFYPSDSPRTSEDSIVSNSEFHSSSYISTSEITEAPDSNTLSIDVPIIDLDAALMPFSDTTKYKRKSEIFEPTIIEEEDEESPASSVKSATLGQQQAASTSTTSLSSATLSSNRARAARNYNSLTMAPLATSSPSPMAAMSKEVKALHRLSSTTNETITPSITPQQLPPQQPQQQPQQQLKPQQQLPQIELEPATPPSLYKTKSVVSHHPTKRFSISSLASFATTTTESRKRKSRIWSWVKGRRSNK